MKKQETTTTKTETKVETTVEQELKAALKKCSVTEWPQTSSRGVGRKVEVLKMFKEQGPVLTMDYISGSLGISKKNVSSIFTYLRKDGFDIRTQKQENIFFAKMMDTEAKSA